MRYPARFEPDEEGGFVVTFRDIPEAITQGDTEDESLAMAKDALLTAMEFYFEDKRSVPPPSAIDEGERFVELPPNISANVLFLSETMHQPGPSPDVKK